MNLSERLAKAAMERRRQPEANAQQVPVTSIESHPSSALLPDRTADPVDAGRVAVMKMRLPDPTNPETTTESSTGLPLWQRPFVDVMREAGLATVTSLPIQPRGEAAIDDDLDDFELAQTIPMPGVRMSEPVIDIDRDELHLPRLATSEAVDLASGTLPCDHDLVNFDDVAIDAEIVFDGPSADALLERWSEDVSADVHDREEQVDGLYRRMVDATQQQPRITFGPIDLCDEITTPTEEPAPLPRADAEHRCPQCGAVASVDIHDPMRGRVHLSCDSCFQMWQVRVESTVHSDEPFMRD
ncbi:MAG TPA: hypothetical protein VM282_27370 [Acidimicrobiales bacterium]|nr:hypothetical protein [Acidimicrobiales bacterium]